MMPISNPRTAYVAALIVSALTAGCSSFPAEEDRTFRNAERELAVAQQEPAVQKHASALLDDAERTLERARAGEDEAHVQHLAYLAQRKVAIARSVAARQAAAQRLRTLAKLETEQKRKLATVRQAERAQVTDTKTEPQRMAHTPKQDRPTTAQQTEEAQALVREPESTKKEIRRDKKQQPTPLTLAGVILDSGQATLMPGDQQRLVPLVRHLRQNSKSRILVEGYTGATGSKEDDLALSLRVAESVRSHLTEEGIDGNRIFTLGRGATGPRDGEDGIGEGRQEENRVEISLFEERDARPSPSRSSTAPSASQDQPEP